MLLHLETETLTFLLVYEAFLRCGIVAIVAKLKNCHVSNSEHKESTTNMKEKDRKFTTICREDHHIDYVFLNKEFEDIYQLESVLHHPNKAHYIPAVQCKNVVPKFGLDFCHVKSFMVCWRPAVLTLYEGKPGK